MNPVELLLWHHNATGSATSYLLTPTELDEIIKAAHGMGYRMESLSS